MLADNDSRVSLKSRDSVSSSDNMAFKFEGHPSPLMTLPSNINSFQKNWRFLGEWACWLASAWVIFGCEDLLQVVCHIRDEAIVRWNTVQVANRAAFLANSGVESTVVSESGSELTGESTDSVWARPLSCEPFASEFAPGTGSSKTWEVWNVTRSCSRNKINKLPGCLVHAASSHRPSLIWLEYFGFWLGRMSSSCPAPTSVYLHKSVEARQLIRVQIKDIVRLVLDWLTLSPGTISQTPAVAKYELVNRGKLRLNHSNPSKSITRFIPSLFKSYFIFEFILFFTGSLKKEGQ